jgi:hypothetical protein
MKASTRDKMRECNLATFFSSLVKGNTIDDSTL